MKLLFTHQAISQAEHIDAWWRAHRDGSPGAFAEDFAAVIASIHLMPLVKTPFRIRDGVVFRRWLLPRTKHHIYYVVDPGSQTVTIAALWGGPREWSEAFLSALGAWTGDIPRPESE